MVLIKSLEDFELFKEFPVQPICYVYYKDSLALIIYSKSLYNPFGLHVKLKHSRQKCTFGLYQILIE